MPVSVSAMDLLETYDQAYKSSPLLKSDYANYQATNADSNIVLGQLLPNITLSGTAKSTGIYDSASQFNGTTNSLTGAAALSQVVFDYALLNIYRSTDQSALSAYADYEYQVQQFILTVAKSYFSVLLAKSNVTVAKEQVKATTATLEQTKLQKNVGLKTESDVKQVEASYYSAIATLVKNENALKASYYELSVLTGIAEMVPLAPIKTNMTVSQPRPANMQEWVNMAKQKNKSLKASLYNQVASENAVEACKGKFLPSISLSASYVYMRDPFFQPGFGSSGVSSGNALAGLLGSGVSTACLVNTSNQISAGSGGQAGIPLNGVELQSAMIGLTFTWNIFNGGTDYAALMQGAENYQNARYSTIQNQRNVIQQTEKDYLAVLTAISSIKAFRQAKISSDIAYQMMLDQYKVGTTTINEVLQQMQITYQNAYDVAQAEFEYITNLLTLKLDAGTLSRKDIQEVNRFLKHN